VYYQDTHISHEFACAVDQHTKVVYNRSIRRMQMGAFTQAEQLIENGVESAWLNIDSTLERMAQHPASAVDPDSIAPSILSIRTAARVCSLLQFLAQEPPTAVVPDSNGGILLEWQHGSDSRWIEISESGEMEQVLIRDGKRIFRRVFNI